MESHEVYILLCFAVGLENLIHISENACRRIRYEWGYDQNKHKTKLCVYIYCVC